MCGSFQNCTSRTWLKTGEDPYAALYVLHLNAMLLARAVKIGVIWPRAVFLTSDAKTAAPVYRQQLHVRVNEGGFD